MNLKNLILGNIKQEDFLNYHNATIIYTNFPWINIRGFVESYRGRYYIHINSNINSHKKKKTILHELAHIELNQQCQTDKDLFAFYIEKYEDEANIYVEKIFKEIRGELDE